jgi:hypothetical protein
MTATKQSILFFLALLFISCEDRAILPTPDNFSAAVRHIVVADPDEADSEQFIYFVVEFSNDSDCNVVLSGNSLPERITEPNYNFDKYGVMLTLPHYKTPLPGLIPPGHIIIINAHQKQKELFMYCHYYSKDWNYDFYDHNYLKKVLPKIQLRYECNKELTGKYYNNLNHDIQANYINSKNYDYVYPYSFDIKNEAVLAFHKDYTFEDMLKLAEMK